jgi:hypothetical protein
MDQLAQVWEKYQDVWNDDLTALGWTTLQLADAESER